MRKLSNTFMENLQNGFLKELTATVRTDKDLDLHIRNNYLNIYYKGNSLLKLAEKRDNLYEVTIDSQFTGGDAVDHLNNSDATARFIARIPAIKANIAKVTSSLEIEYEQMIIRANNRERRNNPDYFIVDRQYSVNRMRFDLLGLAWERTARQRNEAMPCLIEIKFALNPEVATLPEQLTRYYEALGGRAAEVSEELETMFRQKLELGLYNQPEDRLNAMKRLTLARNIEDFRFIIILVDYNPNSSLLKLDKIGELPFKHQIKLFFTGFAMWEQALGNAPDFRPSRFDG